MKVDFFVPMTHSVRLNQCIIQLKHFARSFIIPFSLTQLKTILFLNNKSNVKIFNKCLFLIFIPKTNNFDV